VVYVTICGLYRLGSSRCDDAVRSNQHCCANTDTIGMQYAGLGIVVILRWTESSQTAAR